MGKNITKSLTFQSFSELRKANLPPTVYYHILRVFFPALVFHNLSGRRITYHNNKKLEVDLYFIVATNFWQSYLSAFFTFQLLLKICHAQTFDDVVFCVMRYQTIWNWYLKFLLLWIALLNFDRIINIEESYYNMMAENDF